MRKEAKERMEKILFKDRTCWVCGAKLNDGEDTVCKGGHRLTEYVFTFGFGHRFENCYHVIKAKSYGEARTKMVERFGTKWAFQYKSREEAGVYEFGLREVK